MIYPDTPLAEWRERHKLRIENWECSKCGKPFETTVPIVMQGMAGLSTPVHECGDGFTSVILTPMTEKSKKFWREVLS